MRILAASALVMLLAAGCERNIVHVFGGYGYDETDDCLEAPGAVDVIEGPDPGMCPKLRCWIGPDGSAYVTDEACDAPLDFSDGTQASSGICVKALAAYARPGHGRCPTPADAGAGGSF